MIDDKVPREIIGDRAAIVPHSGYASSVHRNAKLNRVEGVDLFFYLFLQADSQAEKSVCLPRRSQPENQQVDWGSECVSH